MKKKVCVLGWYGKHNCGDESYKFSFPYVFPDYDFIFVDSMSPELKMSCDAFILGGGDILSRDMMAQFDGIGKPRHVISATASDPLIEYDKLKAFSNVIVRDYHSIELLQEKGIRTTWMPDLAMVLRGDPKRGLQKIKKMFQKEDGDCYDKIITVVVNAYLLQEDHPLPYWAKTVEFLQFANQLAEVIDGTSASFVFVPFGGRMPFDDRVSNGWVASRCKFWKKNMVCYDDPAEVQSVLDVISASDGVISTRLHSSIFAVSNGIPLIDITHNHKNRWFLETVGLTNHSIQYRNFDPDWCKNILQRLLFDPLQMKEYLKGVVKKQSSVIKSTTKITLG